jgi:hypothetical protein
MCFGEPVAAVRAAASPTPQPLGFNRASLGWRVLEPQGDAAPRAAGDRSCRVKPIPNVGQPSDLEKATAVLTEHATIRFGPEAAPATISQAKVSGVRIVRQMKITPDKADEIVFAPEDLAPFLRDGDTALDLALWSLAGNITRDATLRLEIDQKADDGKVRTTRAFFRVTYPVPRLCVGDRPAPNAPFEKPAKCGPLTTLAYDADQYGDKDQLVYLEFAFPGLHETVDLDDSLLEAIDVKGGDVAVHYGKEYVAEARNAVPVRASRTVVAVPLTELRRLKQGTPVNVAVSYAGLKEQPHHLLFSHRWSWYGLNGSETVFWVPLGLVASNLQGGEDGMPIAALPINLALGGRHHWDRYYVGGSLAVNYLLYNKPAESQESTASYLKSVGLTALFDFNNDFFVGAGWGFDLTSAHNHPGFMVVAGAGPGLLQFLKSTPK